MKQSNYNIFVEKNGFIVGFNTMENNLIALSKSSYDNFNKYTNNLNDFKKINSKLYDLLKKEGFIIPIHKDENNELRLQNKEYSFNKHYDLTIIPTLDCNLKCWYCWEKHIPNSKMSKDVQKRIKNHIESELGFNNIDSLNVSWFGGEPLLYFNEVVYPLGLSLKKIIEKNNKTFTSTFITNGSLIDENIIFKLKELNPNFQITLDGYKLKHNKVRIKKSNNEGTYDQIIKALYLISENINDAGITIRINFDNSTLENIEELVYDLKDLKREKVSFHLERVWQTKGNLEKNNKLLEEALLLFTANNFEVAYGGFNFNSTSCKSDRYRQAAVNYDGKVYKCIGRPFNEENCEGDLNKEGIITWNREKLANRLGKSTFELEMCLDCKLLPQCMGPCSQKCIENKWENMQEHCTLKTFEITIDEYVIFLFNNYYNTNRINKELINI